MALARPAQTNFTLWTRQAARRHAGQSRNAPADTRPTRQGFNEAQPAEQTHRKQYTRCTASSGAQGQQVSVGSRKGALVYQRFFVRLSHTMYNTHYAYTLHAERGPENGQARQGLVSRDGLAAGCKGLPDALEKASAFLEGGHLLRGRRGH